MTELPKKPDFVIVSGDITIRGHEDGFEEFRHWLNAKTYELRL
ncbi:UNVERIFIED_ORG: 3',5'-cyclic AMP phosphodiesterase CpdA [Rhizobium etli]